MDTTPCIAFLIDADNLNDPEAVAEAFEHLHAITGPSTIRRAYGSDDSLRGLAPVLKQYAVRRCANYALEKNTTDMAMAVDAMEIVCEMRPAVVALGTGDTDFYPLVVRLRERGVRVIAFSLNGKMAEDMRSACSELFFVGKPHASAPAARKTVPRKTAAKTAPAKKTPARKVAARKPAPAPAPAAPPQKAAATVRGILEVVPALGEGMPIRLDQAGQLLHAAAVIGKSASPAKLFRKFSADFELTPEDRPAYVRWLQRGA